MSSAAAIAGTGPRTGISQAVTIETVVTTRPIERSKLPAMTTYVRPIETSALTIIENSTLFKFETVPKYGEARAKPIPTATITAIVPQRRRRRSAVDSPAPFIGRATLPVIAVIQLTPHVASVSGTCERRRPASCRCHHR